MIFCPFLVPAEKLGNAELLTLHLYYFYINIITMALLEFFCQEENGIQDGNLYKLECLVVYFPIFKTW